MTLYSHAVTTTYTSTMENERQEKHFVRRDSRIRELLERAKWVDDEVAIWSQQRVDKNLGEIANEAFTVKAKFVKNLSKTSYNYVNCIPCKLVATFDDGKNCLFLRRDMKIHRNRLYSFVEMKWPDKISTFTSQLADAGFFYEGDGDAVRCFSCNGRISNWEGRAPPIDEHGKLFSKCEFVRRIAKPSLTQVSRHINSFSDDDAVRNTSVSLQLHINRSSETRSYFESEFNRLLSYQNWSYHSSVHPSDLAASGFYCVTGSSGVVECFVCGGRIVDWKYGDHPHKKHLQMFPECPFVRKEETGNRTITSEEKEKELVSLARKDQTLGRVPLQTFSNPSPVTETKGTPSNRPQESEIYPYLKYAKYQHYYMENSRLDTFLTWPMDHCQQPAKLAEAGFYSTQNGDETKCFYCGGGLQNWSPENEPWEEHARWFSRCDWMLQQRGSSFVKMVKRKFGSGDVRRSAENESAPVPRRRPNLMIHHQQAEPLTRNNEPERSVQSDDHSIETELESALETDVAKFMLDMGHSIATIRSVIRKRLEAGDRPFTTSEDLLLAIEEEYKHADDVTCDTSNVHDTSANGNMFRRADEPHVDGNCCYICEYKPVEIITIPCNHSVVCEDCSAKLDVCLKCKQPIELMFFVASLNV